MNASNFVELLHIEKKQKKEPRNVLTFSIYSFKSKNIDLFKNIYLLFKNIKA